MLKSFWHRRAAQKSLNAVVEKKRLNKPFTIKRVRVLLDAALKIEQNFFIQLAKELGLPPVSIHVFVFPSKNGTESQYEHLFDPEEISYFGKFEGDLALMCEKEVDLQINFFAKEARYMSWIATKAMNKLSVGFTGADQRINDIIFDFVPNDTDTFLNELIKYLTILGKLKK